MRGDDIVHSLGHVVMLQTDAPEADAFAEALNARRVVNSILPEEAWTVLERLTRGFKYGNVLRGPLELFHNSAPRLPPRQPMEIDNRLYIPMEIDNRLYIPMEIDNRLYVPMEIDNRLYIPMEIDNRLWRLTTTLL